MSRKELLDNIKYAGYHGDKKKFLRLYIENRISMTSASKAYYDGERLKDSGMPCTCSICSE